MTDLSVWRVVEGGEVHHVVAASKEAAVSCVRKHGFIEDDEDYAVHQLPGEKPLTIREDDGSSQTLTCAEWVAKEGTGFLCSSVY